jgi:hypothetical protein
MGIKPTQQFGINDSDFPIAHPVHSVSEGSKGRAPLSL